LRQSRRVYDLEVNVSKSYNVSSESAIYQLANAVTALAQVTAQSHPELTRGYLAIAMEGSRKAGQGDELVKEIYQIVFPGSPAPIALSPEEFAAKQAEVGK
jgi:hypothetical protein